MSGKIGRTLRLLDICGNISLGLNWTKGQLFLIIIIALFPSHSFLRLFINCHADVHCHSPHNLCTFVPTMYIVGI